MGHNTTFYAEGKNQWRRDHSKERGGLISGGKSSAQVECVFW